MKTGATAVNAMNAFSAASIMAEAEAKAKLAEVEARANRANTVANLQARLAARKKSKNTKGIYSLQFL